MSAEFPTPEQVILNAHVIYDHESGSRNVYAAEINGSFFTVWGQFIAGEFFLNRSVAMLLGNQPVERLSDCLSNRGFRARAVLAASDIQK